MCYVCVMHMYISVCYVYICVSVCVCACGVCRVCVRACGVCIGGTQLERLWPGACLGSTASATTAGRSVRRLASQPRVASGPEERLRGSTGLSQPVAGLYSAGL